MDNLDFVRSRALNCIPQRKLQAAIDAINQGQDSLEDKNTKLIAINRYAEANIPMLYWSLKMDRDFKGDPRLLEKHNEYIADLKVSYIEGKSICFTGKYGVGKTFAMTSILKRCVQKGYSALYTTLGDLVSLLTQSASDDKFIARRELVMVDFLAIDEWDSRYISSENAADLYARSLENVFRARSQNKLPTLMATNSPNPVEIFNGELRNSIDSLISGYMDIFPVAPGKDHRKEKQ